MRIELSNILGLLGILFMMAVNSWVRKLKLNHSWLGFWLIWACFALVFLIVYAVYQQEQHTPL
jgi:hypothetical protein